MKHIDARRSWNGHARRVLGWAETGTELNLTLYARIKLCIMLQTLPFIKRFIAPHSFAQMRLLNQVGLTTKWYVLNALSNLFVVLRSSKEQCHKC